MATAPTVETRPFHTFKEKYVETIFERSRMSPADIELVEKFIEDKKGAGVLNERNHFSYGRERRFIQHLRNFREYSPVDFSEITKDHLVKTMKAVKEAKVKKDTFKPVIKKDGTPAKEKIKIGSKRFSQNTYRDIIANTKMFLVWLLKNKKSKLTHDDLEELKIPPAFEHSIRETDLLTEESRDAMIKACQNSRDRAIISLMFEVALRPVEIGRLTHKDVEFTSNSMNIMTREKTQRERKIPAPLSKMYLKSWLNDCPYEPSPDAVVFCSLTPTILPDGSRQWLPLKDDAIRRQIKTVAKIAGVKNYRKLYQFRHTAISAWINGGIPERMAMQMSHGGDTKMLRIYYHVTNDEVERQVLALNGIETVAPARKAPTMLICQSCGTRNPTTLRFCGNCGTPLTEDAKNEISSERKAIRSASSEFVRADDVERIVKAAVSAALANKQ